MNKKYWLIIIVFCALILGVFYWYLDYQNPEIFPNKNTEENAKLEEEASQQTKSIELEKPPFLKD
ncbi:hypothetical protein ACFL11_00185 [Patescibacteria group bacterium]